MAEVAVLLGAGATMPKIPGVWDITSLLKDWDILREPDPSLPTPFIGTGNLDTRTPLFQHLSDKFRGYWSSEPHFEQLIHVVESLASLYPLPPRERAVDKFRPMLGPFVHPQTPFSSVDGYNYVVQATCEFVLSHVANACDQVQVEGHSLVDIVKALANAHTFDIFSLNYDDVPVHSGVKFETGYGDDPFDFNPLRLEVPRRFGHFQMHGSVLFGNPLLEPVIPKYNSRLEASSKRTSVGSANQMQDGHQAPVLPMISGMRKADKVLHEPYATYHGWLRRGLMSSERWLIVGYGGGDHHVNAALASARRALLAQGRKPKVVVVDYFNFDGSDNATIVPGYPLGDRLFHLLSAWAPDAVQMVSKMPGLPMIQRNQFNQIGNDLYVSFDTTEFAGGAGLGDLLTLLK